MSSGKLLSKRQREEEEKERRRRKRERHRLCKVNRGGPYVGWKTPFRKTKRRRYFDRPILTNNPLLSDSDRSEYRLRFAGVNMLGMCQYLLSAHDLIPC